MALFRSISTSITYAGEVILAPGDLFPANDQVFAQATQYSTQSVPILDAERGRIASFGNAESSQTVSVVVEYDDPEEAMADAMRRASFCDLHQTGTLTYSCGEVTSARACGLTRFAYALSIPPSGVRVTYTYEFIIGVEAES